MDANELFDKAGISWRNNKGIGTAFVPSPLNDKVLVYNILAKVYSKNDKATTIIITNSFTERTELIEFITHTDDEENNVEFKKLIDSKNIRIFTSKFFITSKWWTITNLCIVYRPEEYNVTIMDYLNTCKFKLVILSKLLSNVSDNSKLYKVCPLLDCFQQAELDELRVSSPVEDMWIDVTIDEESETWKLYKYYSDYITTSLNIFGSFDVMQQARMGNASLNISAASICAKIAQENGWNEHLDMNYEFNVKIDELYNPNNLHDRATQTYEAIRNRGILVTDYSGKLDKILEIVKEHNEEKILIINKRGEFATKVCNFLNEYSETEICGNYHNKVDDIPAVDEDNNPVFIKSGKEKGKRKSMGYKAQMTMNERKFNLGKLRCLSMSNAPDKSLNVTADVVIITSPLCEDIKSYLYRFTNVRFTDNKIKLFSIFCRNTIEEQKLFNKSVQDTHKIVNKDEIMANSKNNFDFIITD